MNTSAHMRGDVGFAHLSLLLLAFPALFHPSPSLAGSRWASPCCCDLSAGRGIRSLVHLDHPCSFSTGTWLEPLCFSVWAWTSSASCQLAGRSAASWPAPLQPLRLNFAFSFFYFIFFPFLSPLSYPPRLWKSSSDFPGLLNGEKAEGTLAPSPTSAFPVLLGLETPQEGGDGVSSQLHHPHGLRAAPMPPSLPQGRGKKVASSYPTQTCIPCVDV